MHIHTIYLLLHTTFMTLLCVLICPEVIFCAFVHTHNRICLFGCTIYLTEHPVVPVAFRCIGALHWPVEAGAHLPEAHHLKVRLQEAAGEAVVMDDDEDEPVDGPEPEPLALPDALPIPLVDESLPVSKSAMHSLS